MLGDNKTSLTLRKDLKSQNQTKHINVIYHHIRELMEDGELRIKYIPSALILADGLTKALPAITFKSHQEK